MTMSTFPKPCPRCGDQFPTLMQLQQHHVWAHERPHPDPAVQAYLREHPVGLPLADASMVLPYMRPMIAQGLLVGQAVSRSMRPDLVLPLEPTAVNGTQEGK